MPLRQNALENNRSFTFLRTTALIALLLGAVGSLYFVINAGRHNHSILLRGLFIGWVFLPFIAFLVAHSMAKRWSVLTRKAVYWLTVIIGFGSLIGYSGAFNTTQTKNAFVFLIVPFLSLLLLFTTVLTTRRLSRKTNSNLSR